MENIKKIPYNIEAEQSILGGIFLKPDAVAKVIEIIKSDDFYKHSNKIIYEVMLECYEEGDVIDPLLVIEKLKKRQKLNEVGGEEELFDIMKSVPTAANIENYAKIVKEKAVLRKLIDVGTSIVELAYDGYDEVEEELQWLREHRAKKAVEKALKEQSQKEGDPS